MLHGAVETTDYDPFSAAAMSDPLPLYRELRRRDGPTYLPQYDTWVFARFQDVADLLSVGDNTFQTTEMSLPTRAYLRDRRNAEAPPLASVDAYPLASGGELGSPYYERLRQAHIKPLRPRGVHEIEDNIQRIVRDRLDLLLPRRTFDLTQEFGGIVSASVICGLFGMPLAMAPDVLEAVNGASMTDPDGAGVDLREMMGRMIGLILPWIAKRREEGASGELPLIDGMVQFRLGDRALDDVEVASQLLCVFIGGTETVPKIAAHGLMELYSRPEQLAEIRSDLDRNAAIAVEEMLRYCAPAQWFLRTAHKEVEVAGRKIRPGQRAMALLASAARDEREFADPDEFVWNRRISRVISFGMGRHHCIGAHLARAELTIMVREFLRRVPSCSFEMQAANRPPSSFQWGWTKLPVTIR